MKLNLSGDSNEQHPFAPQLKYTLYYEMVVFGAIWGMSDKKKKSPGSLAICSLEMAAIIPW